MNKNSKEILISLYKIILYSLLLSVFALLMSRVNPSLLKLTRTSVIVFSAFSLVSIMMIPVYGNFEIGHRKSKPVFFSTVVSLLIADTITYVVLIIMGINQFPIQLMLTKGLFYLSITFLVQLFIAWFAAHLGNDIYFKMYDPMPTIIIENDKKIHCKIEKYILSHDKQYNLINTYSNVRLKDINFINIENVISIGMGSDFENNLIEYCYYNDIDLLHDSDVYDMFSGDTKTRVIDDILMNYYPKEKMTFMQVILKRMIDVLGSFIFLILVSPLFLVIAIAIKIDDGGPVFYRQERLTKDRKVFRIIKFRSMKLNSGNTPVRENDNRITKTGHLLRKYRVDELPQFLNILKGDMSLVGPRPESVEIMAEIVEDVPEFEYRLKVKGGLTGYAQIFGKYNTSPKQKILLDLKYIESISVINDIKLILQTIGVFFKGDSTEAFEED